MASLGRDPVGRGPIYGREVTVSGVEQADVEGRGRGEIIEKVHDFRCHVLGAGMALVAVSGQAHGGGSLAAQGEEAGRVAERLRSETFSRRWPGKGLPIRGG